MLLSTNWQQQIDEPTDVFSARIKVQNSSWQNNIQIHGNCYMIKFGECDIRPMFEDQIDVELLRQQVISPSSRSFDCPLCQPYDNFNYTTNQYEDRRHLTRIINPGYPSGFIDKEGVWCKCPCLLKGEKHKKLKFINKRSQS